MTASREESLAALNWLVEAGADEATTDEPVDRFNARAATIATTATPKPTTRQNPPLAQIKPANLAPLATDGFGSALEISAKCRSLEELKAAIESFDGSQ